MSRKSVESHALIIAIGQYQSFPHSSQLEASAGNALKIKDVLSENYDFMDEHIVTLCNHKAAQKAIESSFNRLVKGLRPTDTLFIYFSGICHYNRDAKMISLVPYDSAENKTGLNESNYADALEKKIPFELIWRVINRCQAEKILLVLDAPGARQLFASIDSGYSRPAAQKSIHIITSDYGRVEFGNKPQKVKLFSHCFLEALLPSPLDKGSTVLFPHIRQRIYTCMGRDNSTGTMFKSISRENPGSDLIFKRRLRGDEDRYLRKFEGMKEASPKDLKSRGRLIAELRELQRDCKKLMNRSNEPRVQKKTSHLLENIIQFKEKIEKECDITRKLMKQVDYYLQEQENLNRRTVIRNCKELHWRLEKSKVELGFDSQEFSGLKNRLFDFLNSAIEEDYKDLLLLLRDPAVQCLRKRKECKRFLSNYRRLSLGSHTIPDVSKRLKMYNCHTLSLTAIPTIRTKGDFNLRDHRWCYLTLGYKHDIATGIAFGESKDGPPSIVVLATPYVWYQHFIAGDIDGRIEIFDNHYFQYETTRANMVTLGMKLKWSTFHLSPLQGGLYASVDFNKAFFSVKSMAGCSDIKLLGFREVNDKKSTSLFRINVGMELTINSSFGLEFNIPVATFGNKDFIYEIQTLYGSVRKTVSLSIGNITFGFTLLF